MAVHIDQGVRKESRKGVNFGTIRRSPLQGLRNMKKMAMLWDLNVKVGNFPVINENERCIKAYFRGRKEVVSGRG